MRMCSAPLERRDVKDSPFAAAVNTADPAHCLIGADFTEESTAQSLFAKIGLTQRRKRTSQPR